jgi:biopolymer transport protein ExbD
MAMAIGSAEGQAYSHINMTPLIDVMLVLLIIFIITLPHQTHAVKIDNPSPHAPIAVPEIIELSIDFDGTLTWNNQQVDRAVLPSLISRAARKSPQPEVHIRVDRFARYEIVAQSLADLQRLGLHMIGFVNHD